MIIVVQFLTLTDIKTATLTIAATQTFRVPANDGQTRRCLGNRRRCLKLSSHATRKPGKTS